MPGIFELPVAAARLADTGFDAIVTLGVVIRGDHAALRLRLRGRDDRADPRGAAHRHPGRLGVLTCDDEQQALDRAGLPGSREDKGDEAATAASSRPRSPCRPAHAVIPGRPDPCPATARTRVEHSRTAPAQRRGEQQMGGYQHRRRGHRWLRVPRRRAVERAGRAGG